MLNSEGKLTALRQAYSDDGLNRVRRAVEEGADPLDLDLFGSPILFDFAAKGDVEGIRFILGTGVSVNIVGGGGMTALLHAANAGQTEAAELLLSQGADPNISNDDGYLPLYRVPPDCKRLIRILWSTTDQSLIPEEVRARFDSGDRE